MSSSYKQGMIDHLKGQSLTADNILSIGLECDDRKYFRDVNCREYVTLDRDQTYSPDIFHDMNKQILNDDGDTMIEYRFMDYFDIVLALNLWEYIYDPVTAHKNIFSLLKNGGKYIGTYPFVYGIHPPKGSDCLRYTEEGIAKLMTISGLTVEKIFPVRPRTNILDFYHLEEQRIRKDADHEVTGYIVHAKK